MLIYTRSALGGRGTTSSRTLWQVKRFNGDLEAIKLFSAVDGCNSAETLETDRRYRTVVKRFFEASIRSIVIGNMDTTSVPACTSRARRRRRGVAACLFASVAESSRFDVRVGCR
ncbi:hypothetical protein EVAR_3419_1 [Eumeta japonica]|uniref:Uncharacterized protein n=1 Tax=Eumeta variegata TaxID=151549 RepID=A0A4C1SUR5_EUMVA|nr:hypothetical protein EVAR_3419_1 [Eumeta japonica]